MSTPEQVDKTKTFLAALKDNDLAKVKYYIEEAKLVDPKAPVPANEKDPRRFIGNALVALARETRWWPFAKGAERDSRAALTQYLIDVGYDINGRSVEHPHFTAMHHACAHERPDILKVLLDNNADVHASSDKNNWCCLAEAFRLGSDTCIRMVIEKDPTILLHVDSQGTSVFLLAAEYWSRRSEVTCILRMMFEKLPTLLTTTTTATSSTLSELLNMKSTCSPYLNPLLMACSKNGYDVVKILLEQKVAPVDIYATHPQTGENALHIVCRHESRLGATIDLIYLLVEKGGARLLLGKDKLGQTPVYKAIDVAELGNVKRLIALGGADAVWNAPRDKEGFSPLEFAQDLVAAGSTQKQVIVDYFTAPPSSPSSSYSTQQNDDQQKPKQIGFFDFLVDPSSDNLNALLEAGKNSHKPERPPPIINKEVVAAEAVRIQQEYEAAERAAADADEAEYQSLLRSDSVKAHDLQEQKFLAALKSLDLNTIRFLITNGRIDVNGITKLNDNNSQKRNWLQMLLSEYYNDSSRFCKANRIAKYLITEAKINLFYRCGGSRPCVHYIMNFSHFWRDLFDIVYIGNEYLSDADLLDERKTYSCDYGSRSSLNIAVERAQPEYSVPKILARAPQLAARGTVIPFVAAAANCDIPVCQMLLDTKLFDINQIVPTDAPWYERRTSDGPAFYQCATSRSTRALETMKFLLDRGADLFSSRPDTGDTALHYHAKGHRTWPEYACIRFLLEHGGVPILLHKNRSGNTALEAAFVETGNVTMFQCLICLGGGAAYFTKEMRRALLLREPFSDLVKYNKEGLEGFNQIKSFLTTGRMMTAVGESASENKKDNHNNNNHDDEDAIVQEIVSFCCSKKYDEKTIYKPIITAAAFESFAKLQQAIASLIEQETKCRDQLVASNSAGVQLQEATTRINIFAREEPSEFSNIVKQKAPSAKIAALKEEQRRSSTAVDVACVAFGVGYIGWWVFQSFYQKRTFWKISHQENFVVALSCFAGGFKMMY